MLTPEFIALHCENQDQMRAEALAGLILPQAQVSPKFLYDALGSRLFDAITELDEYYPTRTEAAILSRDLPMLARVLPRAATLIDLGAGNCTKAERLLDTLRPVRYVAVDISVQYLRESLLRLQAQHPRLPVLGLGLDFSSALPLPPQVGHGARLMFYPGSSIGNFTPGQALDFLRGLRHAALAGGGAGGLLIGVDLVKDAAILQAAYDDPLGVTAAFNRNLLRRLNRLAHTDFVLSEWQHVAFYNGAASRIEMHLQARHSLRVQWPGGTRLFAAGERLHTENACKWTRAGFDALLAQAGWHTQACAMDERGWYAVFAAEAEPL